MRTPLVLAALIVLSAFTVAVGASTTQPVPQRLLLDHPQPLNTTIGDPAATYNGSYSFGAYQPKIPGVSPEAVTVAQNVLFNNSGRVPYTVSVVLPNSSYALEVLKVSVKEFGGRQYDRPLYVFADGVPIFWGSTQEIFNSTALTDVTFYENLLRGNVTFRIVLVNFYVPSVRVTGVYELNATLYLYPGSPPAGLPTDFIPLWVNAYGYSSAGLNQFHPSITQGVTMPAGTYRAAAVVYTEGTGLDEFWYANEPATRSVLLYYNGFLADVVNPFETVYTGGIDPFYWRPMPSINTLGYHNPYIAEITPLLATGLNAKITVSVTNLVESYELTGLPFFSWVLSGALALWVNQSNPLVSGSLQTAKQVYVDSSPIFNPTTTGMVYQEAGHYLVEYEATLKFAQGVEHSSVVQGGSFQAYQTLTQLLEVAELQEQFYEHAADQGFYNATLEYQGSYPVSFVYSAFTTPLTNPSVIPYEAVYAQNGSITLGYHVKSTYTYNGQAYAEGVDEDLTALGGFSSLLEVINQYGGAVILSLSANYAQTTKSLKAYWLLDGKTITETFSAQAVSPNVSDSVGYYNYVSITYT